MNGERYPAYPKLGGGALNEMSEMKKMIVMVVIDEKDEQNPHQKRSVVFAVLCVYACLKSACNMVQSSAFIMWSNIVRYYINNCRN